MRTKDYWDLLTDLSQINTAHGLIGPDRDAMAFAVGLNFLENHKAPETVSAALNCLFGVASMRSFEALAGFCLKKGADIESCSMGALCKGDASALASVASSKPPYADPARTIAWLLKSGADVNARGGDSLLSACCHSNDIAIDVLLKSNANPLLSGAAALFASSWTHHPGTKEPIGMMKLRKAPGLARSSEWRAAEMSQRLAQAANGLDAQQARATLKQLDAVCLSLSEEARHWAGRPNTLPRAMNIALLAAHKASSSKDRPLTIFLQMLFEEGLVFAPAQNWPRNTVLMAAHHLWRGNNPRAAHFLDTMLLADAAGALCKLDTDFGVLAARSSWTMVAARQLATQEERALAAIVGPTQASVRKSASATRL